MRFSNIVTALIVFFIICLLVFFRGPLAAIFTFNASQQAIMSAEADFKAKTQALAATEKAVEAAESELEAQKEAVEKAKTELAASEEILQKTIDDPSRAEALRNEALEPPKFKVEVAGITPQDVPSGLALSGKAEAGRRVTVTAEAAGRIISNPISAGTRVIEGDILCSIDPGTTRAQLDQAEATFRNAQNQLNIQSKLQERGLASEAGVISARAAYEQAQAAVEQMRQQVGNLQVKAPFSGKLATDTAELGSLMSAGTPCATLVALDTIKLEAFVAERDIDRVKLSAPVIAIFNNLDAPIEGTITSIGSSADPVTRAYPVEVMIDSNENEILDGTSAKIYVSIEGVKGYMIPQNAITLDAGGTIGVMVYRDNQAIFSPVNIELDTPDGTWVTGLDGEVELIVQGQEYAKDGVLVEAYRKEKTAQ